MASKEQNDETFIKECFGDEAEQPVVHVMPGLLLTL